MVGKKINDTYAEVNLKVLKENFLAIKKYAGKRRDKDVKVCSIIKANAYGHGIKEIAEALTRFGTDYLGTADYNESILLHDHLNKLFKKKIPILCLGTLAEKKKYFEDIISRDIEITITDLKTARMLENFAGSANKKLKVQIQVDSGINRIGFLLKDSYEAVQKIKKFSNLVINGIYSHFATSEIADNAYAKKQLFEFKSLVQELEFSVMKFENKHICNSGGILNYNDSYFDMVRPGISLYGYYPDRKELVEEIGIQPVMTLKSKISFIKELNKNQSISYGRKYFTKQKTQIASIPVGYGDGYSRLLTNRSKVMINNKLYPTVGSVCMDWVMAELGSHSGVKVNDEVILFGKEYPADNLSKILGTIPYEITCNISSRVQRVYVN